MIVHTAPLAQSNEKQSTTGQINSNRAEMLRRMLPMMLVNAVAPFTINMVAQHYMPTIDSLLLASSVPALWTLGSLIWKKHIDVMGLIVIASLLLTAVFALAFQSPRLLLLQGSAVNGLLGIGMLISLLFPRPVLFYLMRSIMTQNDSQRIARFNADWAFPQVRSFYRILTIVWGCVTAGHLLLITALVFTLPISLMLIISPIMGFAFVIPAAQWSMHYMRKNQRLFAQLRQERDRASEKVA